MSIDLELAPKQKRPAGQPCCEPVVYPDVEREQALRIAEVAKALGDPIRLQLVDVLRKHAGKVCVCELVPLFDISQPTLSHHLKKLRQAGIVAAGALYAMQHHVDRLQVDHDNAKAFAEAIHGIDGITLDPADVETNLVFFNVDPELGNAAQLSSLLKQRGVRINASGSQRLRACTHLDVGRDMVLRAADAVAESIAGDFAAATGAEFGPYVRG